MFKAGLAGAFGLATIGSTLFSTHEIGTKQEYREGSLGSFVCANRVKMLLRSTREQNRCRPPVEVGLRDVLREQGRQVGLAQGVDRMGYQLVADTINGKVAFVKFTRPDKEPSFINPDNLEDIEEDPDRSTFTQLTLGSGVRIDVAESPSEAAKLVEDAGGKLIKLTRPDKKCRWINPDQIDDIRPSEIARQGFNTNIVFESRTSIYVVEDPKTVAKHITEARR
jgi:uncharacterized protein YlzI (FlbEa/FlbD family)